MSTKNYLEMYASATTPKFQEGGAAPAPAGAPAAPQGGGDPAAQLQQMVGEYAQSRDPQLAVAIADALVSMMGGAQGGAPAPAMNKGGRMNQPAAPMFKKGGVL